MTLLQMSLFGSIMIITVIVVRNIAVNRLPKTTFYILWAVILCRLLLPFPFSSPLSIYGIFQKLFSSVSAPSTASPVTTLVPVIINDASPMTQTPLSFSLWFFLWAGGFLICLLFFSFTYLNCRKELLTSLPIENSFFKKWLTAHSLRRKVAVHQCDKISAPLTYGIWKPVIVLPKYIDLQNHQQLEYIFTHELVHIRRFDLLFKSALILVLCIHWFNPLVWIMYVLANRDLELSCDEKVLHLLGEENKSLYALTLLNLEEQRNYFYPLCNNFSKNSIEERVVSIMKIQKKSFSGTLAALIIIACITSACGTSPQKTPSFSSKEPVSSVNVTAVENADIPEENYFDVYEPYGLTYDSKANILFYNGKLVRYFEDFYPVDKENPNTVSGISFLNENGVVDVHAVRDLKNLTVNADGSYDPKGTLTGLETFSQEEFDKRTPTLVQNKQENTPVVEANNSIDFSLIEVYAPFGIKYEEKDASFSYKGEVIAQFCDDIANRYFSCQGGTVSLKAIYKDGVLSGVEKISQQEADTLREKIENAVSISVENKSEEA